MKTKNHLNTIHVRKLYLNLSCLLFLFFYLPSLQAQGELLQAGEAGATLGVGIFTLPNNHTGIATRFGLTGSRKFQLGLGYSYADLGSSIFGGNNTISFFTPELSTYLGNGPTVKLSVGYPITDDFDGIVYSVNFFNALKHQEGTISPQFGISYGEEAAIQIGLAGKFGNKNSLFSEFFYQRSENFSSLVLSIGYLFAYHEK